MLIRICLSIFPRLIFYGYLIRLKFFQLYFLSDGITTWNSTHGIPHIEFHTRNSTHGIPHTEYHTWYTTHGIPHMELHTCPISTFWLQQQKCWFSESGWAGFHSISWPTKNRFRGLTFRGKFFTKKCGLQPCHYSTFWKSSSSFQKFLYLLSFRKFQELKIFSTEEVVRLYWR